MAKQECGKISCTSPAAGKQGSGVCKASVAERMREPQKQLTKERTLMEESNKDNQSKPTYTDEQVREAVKIVNAVIAERREKIAEMAKTEEQDPVGMDGITITGYTCTIMVDPKDVADIFLKHDYPVWNVLGEDAPTAMWEELARKFGLDIVEYVDI